MDRAIEVNFQLFSEIFRLSHPQKQAAREAILFTSYSNQVLYSLQN
jgi:hypothetical protein